MNVPVGRVKLPGHVTYDENSDPIERVKSYQDHMTLRVYSYISRYENFSLTMIGMVKIYF